MSNLQVLTSRAILNHPLNESGTSWKFLVVAQDSLTALEGYFHHQGDERLNRRGVLQQRILESVAADVGSCERVMVHADDASIGDFLPVALHTYKATPERASEVAERLMYRWAWAEELVEVEREELFSVFD